MKRQLHEVWKEQDGFWKVQAPKGILSFHTKKSANNWVNSFEKTFIKEKDIIKIGGVTCKVITITKNGWVRSVPINKCSSLEEMLDNEISCRRNDCENI